MNPNDLLAQQQELLNRVMNQQHHFHLVMIAVWVAGLLATAWVLYMFYARLRDIATELRKIRVTYEMEREREARRSVRAASAAQSEPPSPGESRYMPKR